MTWITMMVWSFTWNQTSWNVRSNGPQEVLLPTKLVEMTEIQLSYLKSPQMTLLKCCSQYVSKVGKLSSGQFNSVQSLSRVRLFVTPWTTARQTSLSITNTWGLFKLICIELVVPSNHLILCSPLLLLSSIFPSTSGSFPVSQFFVSAGQSTGVSASTSVLPVNTQD